MLSVSSITLGNWPVLHNRSCIYNEVRLLAQGIFPLPKELTILTSLQHVGNGTQQLVLGINQARLCVEHLLFT